jgi:hypothetical protein
VTLSNCSTTAGARTSARVRSTSARVAERQRLGAARERALGADVAGKERPHRVERLDRHDVEARLQQRRRQAPASRANIEHTRTTDRFAEVAMTCGS